MPFFSCKCAVMLEEFYVFCKTVQNVLQCLSGEVLDIDLAHLQSFEVWFVALLTPHRVDRLHI